MARSTSGADVTRLGDGSEFVVVAGVSDGRSGAVGGNGHDGRVEDAGECSEGRAVALSSDGNTALFSAPNDNNAAGAVWVFTRSGATWTRQGDKLVSSAGYLGTAIGLSAAGDLAVFGGATFSAWAMAPFAVPSLSILAPGTAHSNTPFNLTVTAIDSAGATVTGYDDAIHFTSTDPSATLPPDSTLVNGSAQFPATLIIPGNQSITATDTSYATITGASGVINVLVHPPTLSKSFGASSIPLHQSTTLSFTLTNPNPKFALTQVAFTDELPAGLVVASPNGLTGSCGGGTITANPHTARISLTGAAIAAKSSCSFAVKVTATSVGTKKNVTSPVTSAISGRGQPASATLTATAP